MGSMRWFLVLVLVGCSGDPTNVPDAAVDAAPGPDTPLPPDFYGEACSPPSSLGFVSTCRPELPYPKAYCTPEGVCRPFCERCPTGGVEMWAFPTSPARVCYCVPP